MGNLNGTWKDFSTRIDQRDVSDQVLPNYLYDEDQSKVQMASLCQEMKNLHSELQEHQVRALETSKDLTLIERDTKKLQDYASIAAQWAHPKLV